MKIIYLLLDAISYEHSWLSNQGYMPNLKNLTSEGVNFHNHYSVTHNTRGNLATMFYGASSLLLNSTDSPVELRNMVTSKGGVTAEALDELEKGNLEEVFKTAIRKAHKRAKDLSY